MIQKEQGLSSLCPLPIPGWIRLRSWPSWSPMWVAGTQAFGSLLWFAQSLIRSGAVGSWTNTLTWILAAQGVVTPSATTLASGIICVCVWFYCGYRFDLIQVVTLKAFRWEKSLNASESLHSATQWGDISWIRVLCVTSLHNSVY